MRKKPNDTSNLHIVRGGRGLSQAAGLQMHFWNHLGRQLAFHYLDFLSDRHKGQELFKC